MPTPPRESISLDDGHYDPADYRPADLPEWAERAMRHAPDRDDRPRAERRAERRVPANAPRPQDRLPKQRKPKKRKKSAAEREAEGIETVEVEYDGEVYEIPADVQDWPVDVSEAFERGLAVTAIRGLLGRDQWAKVSAKKYRLRQLGEMYERLAEAGGFSDSGNSGAFSR